MNIFLAGATGAIGRPLLARMQAAGHSVTAITRSPDRVEPIRAYGARAVVCDVFDRDRVRQAVIDAQPDVVMHQLTSIPHKLDARRVVQEFAMTNRLRTEGTQILMDAAQAAGARRFIAQSITAYYTPNLPGLATEDQPLYTDAPAAFAELVEAITTLERIVLHTPGVDGIVLRYGYFYGPGTTYAVDGNIADNVRQRSMPIVGEGNGVFSFIHVDDAADATMRALDQGEPGIYNIVDDDPAPVSEWLPYYAQLLNAPKPMRVPRVVGQLAAGRFAVYFMDEQRGASNQKARQELGWQPRYASWHDGWQAEFAGQSEPHPA